MTKAKVAKKSKPVAVATPNKSDGLYDKFQVIRRDGSDLKGGPHEKCDYFVLDLTHDVHAKAAIMAYAISCAAQHPMLAADLLVKYAEPTCKV